MNLAVLLLDLRIRRVATLLWVGAAILIVVLYLAIYPSVRDTPGIDEYIKQLPEALRAAFAPGDYRSPSGYLESEVFSGLMPVILLVLVIGRGSSSIAGEEELGRLDVVMAHPVRRRAVYLAKTTSLIVTAGVVTFAGVLLPILLVGPAFKLNISVFDLAAACFQLFLFALLAGVLAEASGAATGSRAIAIAVPSAVFALGFLVNTVGQSVSWLVHFRPLTPWRWYNGNLPLTHGIGGLETVVLGSACLVVIVVGMVLFARRDLRV